MKEVLDNAFLDSRQKKEYTNLLESFDIPFHKEDVSEDIAKEIEKAKKQYQARADMYSWVMSLIAGVVAGIASKYQYFFKEHVAFVVILASLSVILCLLFYIMSVRHSNEEEMKERDKQ